MNMSAPLSVLNSTASVRTLAKGDEVSWPFIFWNLLPIALNSMSQPAGSISPYMTAEQSILFRACPAICIFDAATVLLRFLWLVVVMGDMRKALFILRSTRFDEEPRLGDQKPLQNAALFRTILFIPGTLLPAIKLLACSGIRWAHALVGVYVG